MFFRNMWMWILAAALFLSACEGITTPAPSPTPTQTPPAPTRTPRPTPTPTLTLVNSPTPAPTATPLPASLALDPADWKDWPVLPIVPAHVRAIYEKGLALGNDPHAVSIFGDCQTKPDAFLGIYATNSAALDLLPPDLQETALYFSDSLNRASPTSKDGTTPGALLWTQWHQGKFGCSFKETPVDCELRIHRPAFVIIQIGTHFESRNTDYLRRVINKLLAQGVVPILATKADNREKDDRINKDMAALAVEFNLPLWNFWAALSDLPDRGLYVMKGRENQGAVYLNDEATARHRLTGLAALNLAWRAATGK